MGLFGNHFDDDRVDSEGNLAPEVFEKLQLQVGETPFMRDVSVQDLRMLLQDEPKLNPRTDEEFLLRFLRAKSFNVGNAFHAVKNYYKIRRKYPELFTNLYPANFKHLFHLNPFLILRRLDPNGCPVVIFKAGAYDPSAFPMEVGMQITFLCAQLLYLDPIAQLKGFVFVIDCEGSGFNHIKANPPHKIGRYVFFSQNSIPLKLKAVHVVNESTVMDFIYAVAKPFISKKVRSRIHFHGRDRQSLHKFIPADILPQEYDGTYGPIDMNTVVDIFLSCNDIFVEDAKYGYLED